MSASTANANPANLTLLVKTENLDPQTYEAIGWESRTSPQGVTVRIPKEASKAYFQQGYVSADQPRDSAYTVDVMAAKVGWALADAAGNVLGEFETPDEAEAARQNATATISMSL